MNLLVIAIAIVLLCFIAPLWVNRFSPTESSSESDERVHPNPATPLSWLELPSLMTIVLLLIPLFIYGQIGRFDDWNKGFVDENIDYLIAADINKNARAASESPYDRVALLNLANAYAEGGMYDKAVETLNELLAIETDAAVLGMKANALYYRDGRDMSMEVTLTLSQALALDPNDVQSLLLIATHAFLNRDFQKAIVHWQQLLDSNNQGINRASINSAIVKAEQAIANRTVTASE